MNERNLWRAKGLIGDMFVYGEPHLNCNVPVIYDDGISVPIKVETAGRFVTISKGISLFEGDVLVNPQGKKGVIIFTDFKFQLNTQRSGNTMWLIPIEAGFLKSKELIGNIIDNPQLLD
jgi:hypothetical protein